MSRVGPLWMVIPLGGDSRSFFFIFRAYGSSCLWNYVHFTRKLEVTEEERWFQSRAVQILMANYI